MGCFFWAVGLSKIASSVSVDVACPTPIRMVRICTIEVCKDLMCWKFWLFASIFFWSILHNSKTSKEILDSVVSMLVCHCSIRAMEALNCAIEGEEVDVGETIKLSWVGVFVLVGIMT